jgi:anti-sigma factor RsiW
VIIALRCEEFEQYLSDYLEGETSLEQTEKMDQHVLQCPACQVMAQGVRQVCHQLGRLAQISPPASFKLGLWPAVQERQARRQERRWHALSFGLALGVALLILLWPEPQVQIEAPEYASWGAPAYQENPRRAASSRTSLYGGQLPERADSGLRAQAQVHLTAF